MYVRAHLCVVLAFACIRIIKKHLCVHVRVRVVFVCTLSYHAVNIN